MDLERAVDHRRVSDTDAFLRAQRGKPIVIDEIHRVPEHFDTLRGVIDDRRAAGERNSQFLLPGSAGINLMRQSSETLAGRVAYIELPPINTLEFIGKASDVDRLLARNDSLSLAWRRDFIRSYLEQQRWQAPRPHTQDLCSRQRTHPCLA